MTAADDLVRELEATLLLMAIAEQPKPQTAFAMRLKRAPCSRCSKRPGTAEDGLCSQCFFEELDAKERR